MLCRAHARFARRSEKLCDRPTRDVFLAQLSPLPVYSVAATTASVVENAGAPVVFEVTRTGDNSQAESVTYSLSGTAAAGVDYTALSGTINFAAGQTTSQIQITPTTDLLYEADET